MSKSRLDQALVDRGLAETRSQAQALIMAGEVRVQGQRVDKPGTAIKPDAQIELAHQGPRWVSRGAHKLLHGLEHFQIDPQGQIAIDVGASTGGFTQVLLEKGAKHVFAVDVGHGQLAWSLRQDPRVTVLEKTNARHLTNAQITEPASLIVCDASFISLKKVLPASLALTTPKALACVLIKPQFEAGKSDVGKGGVIRDAEIHKRVCEDVQSFFEALPDWSVMGVTQSPILGPKGNTEFLLGLVKTNSQ